VNASVLVILVGRSEFYFPVAYTCEIAVIYLLYGDLRITVVEYF
jgi:hypothetical protein